MRKSVTLIELLIAIAISSLLGVTVAFMFRNTLDIYLFSEEQALMQKILDETIEEISGEGFKNYGIKDALEILIANKNSLSFSCPWIEETRRFKRNKKTLELKHPLKPGASIPILETKGPFDENFSPVPITFIPHKETSTGKTKDVIILKEQLPHGSQIRIIFEPQTEGFSDVIMNISWDKHLGRIIRTYKNKQEFIPRGNIRNFKLTEVTFQYFNNTNHQIPAPVSEELLSAISAVKVTLCLENRQNKRKRQAIAFINLRNARSSGKGITLREGMKINIPDSAHIKTLSIGNIVGVNDGDIIRLKAQPQKGIAWRITIFLKMKEDTPVIGSYTIEYPPGVTVFSEQTNQSLELPFNLLTIGKNGRYDYDIDENTENIVNLKGNIILSVEKMTTQGAAIFVRP